MNEPISIVQTLRSRNAELETRVAQLEHQVSAFRLGLSPSGRKCATCWLYEKDCECGPASEFLENFSRIPDSAQEALAETTSLTSRARERLRRVLRKVL